MRILACALLGASLSWSTGCAREEQSVLLVLKTTQSEFFSDIHKGFSEELSKSKPDLVITVKAGEKPGDITGQTAALDAQYGQLVAGRRQPLIRGLVLTPSSSGGDLVPQIASYRRANIPVVLLDTSIERDQLVRANTDYNLLILSDNKAGGKLAAKVIADELKRRHKPCEVLLLNGNPDQDTDRKSVV